MNAELRHINLLMQNVDLDTQIEQQKERQTAHARGVVDGYKKELEQVNSAAQGQINEAVQELEDTPLLTPHRDQLHALQRQHEEKINALRILERQNATQSDELEQRAQGKRSLQQRVDELRRTLKANNDSPAADQIIGIGNRAVNHYISNGGK